MAFRLPAPTRQNKNIALVAANLILWPIVAVSLFIDPASVGTGLRVWVVVLPLVAALSVVLPLERAKLAHVALFLCTGAALGLTIGALVSGELGILSPQVLWLPIGAAAAVFHYWPSVLDEYAFGRFG
ncbi:MAG: hypothetical protein AAF730_00630 [Bacteroidota bacterium]